MGTVIALILGKKNALTRIDEVTYGSTIQ